MMELLRLSEQNREHGWFSSTEKVRNCLGHHDCESAQLRPFFMPKQNTLVSRRQTFTMLHAGNTKIIPCMSRTQTQVASMQGPFA